MSIPIPEWWYGNIPEYMREGIFLYIQEGIEPGSFLRAVFENDLARAAKAADATNIMYFREYADMLLQLPLSCWGSKEKVDDWIAHKGARGHEIRNTG